MKTSLRQRLLKYVRGSNGWVASGKLQELAMQAGYTPQTAGRQLRLLAEDGELEVSYQGKRKHAHYRSLPTKKVEYRVAGKQVLVVNEYD